jgi:TonB-dependent receptor
MSNSKQLAGLLLLTTALTLPAAAFAQGTTGGDGANAGAIAQEDPLADEELADQEGTPAEDYEETGEEPEISIPGGDIVVTGRRSRDVTRSSTQVITVLTNEQIARTGEGDIAGALGRVTGLSVQGNGFVFVRGLGDRYSLALLNGLPLPSPEPLSRVVPLDIFPTNIVASSLVQKTYSANFPGEFGGGVINLTTRAIPEESFLTISAGISGDSETTGRQSYTVYGSDYDWFGFDDGTRDVPGALQSFFDSGERLSSVDRATQRAIQKDLIEPDLVVLQRIKNTVPNWSGSISGGTAFDIGDDSRLGVIASFAISNKWRNRLIQKDFAPDADLALQRTTQAFTTDNRVLVNGLLGFGLEVGDHKFRWTNVYIRDSIKQSVLGIGQDFETGNESAEQDTNWFERQLIDTQFVGELDFGDLDLDLRAGYAQTARESPYEYSFDYFYNPNDPIQATDENGRPVKIYRNALDGQRSDARVAFSDLTEDLYYGGVDVSYRLNDWITATVGYAYTDTKRFSSRREFRFISSAFPRGFSYLSPVYLLGDAVIDFGEDPNNTDPYQIVLQELTEDTPAFNASLEINAGYGQINIAPITGLSIDLGVRYETADQSVSAAEVFNTPNSFDASTSLSNDYFLPAATITYDFDNGLQVRASASKTIARPQFRELIFQPYQDPETTRLYNGNPLLRDSELINAEARAEYYWGRNRASLAGFYKEIDRPIEAYSTLADGRVRQSFANAPKATLYGAEFDLQYNHDLFDLGGWFETKRAIFIANYTYTQSDIKVSPGDETFIFGTSNTDATLFFRDGVPLTGQSDHLANLQIGFEDTDYLQQFTVLMSYASKRVVARGFNNLPDIIEKPGFQLDVVAREEVNFLNMPIQLKFEVRNITGTNHQEYQDNGTTRIEVNTWDVGTSVSASASINF